MKKLLFLIFATLPFFSFAQQHQLGLRLGEPFSVTYKTDLDDRFSIEALVGRGSPNSGAYYRRSFENNRPLSSAVYQGHTASDALSLSGRVAYHEDITSEFNITEGTLLAYVGLGAQLRSVRVNYVYFTPNPADQTVFRNESRTNVDLGPEGFIGSEYIFQDLPISVFAEVGLFLELVDRPGHLKLQGGLGVRYLF
ncbi:hypothetical protein ADIS_3992 [Lunatimonas lonarensis]|uniref:Outer membrane protein beta-barrel domain-containing protein n=1 Tax=Lunatimonas lonarensis TaxID=1232681 RepID=R7ZNI9_9BACT|nr:hypothetical protein [Lunatimonas lonarensis]EON75589.1 hypothetical protein ADIS_3992 [Lunatimonas lonarensis]